MKGNAKTYGAVAIFIVAVMGYVIMAVLAPDQDYRGVFTFATVGAAWLGLTGHQEELKAGMTKVQEQTNGAMDKRIEAAVRKVLKEFGIESPIAHVDSPKPKVVRKPRISRGSN